MPRSPPTWPPEIEATDPLETTETIPKSNDRPSTAGMTTKVAKGSLWTLGGSVLPLAVSFISTPFIIRFLGAESYGVLLLVGLIPTYFLFADFGMSIASTKFASEAYGEGDKQKEAEVVWTATSIAIISASLIAVPLVLFSYQIVKALNVPEHLIDTASIALKITSASFVIGILASVVNSPMLARLRMDLNTFTSALPKILLAAVTPFILYFGGGIVAAVGWAFVVSAATLVVVFLFSRRLLPPLTVPRFSSELVRPLAKVGGAWFFAIVAGVLIGHLEKFVLTSRLSATALAYYSIAFTFANIATIFSQAMLQSMFPAFSQMVSIDKRPQLNLLFSRGIRLTIVTLLPVTVFLAAIGGPFLTIWAGEEFGVQSAAAFYILLAGFSLSMFSVMPYSILLAAGRTDYFAKMYWFELPMYAVLCWYLIGRFGVAGAAAAYALRNVFDGFWANFLCWRLFRLSYGLQPYLLQIFLASSLFIPILVVAYLDNWSPWLPVVIMLSFAGYGFLAWRNLLHSEEKVWLRSGIEEFFAR